MKSNVIFKKYSINKLVTGLLLFGFVVTGFLDLLVNRQSSYSSILGRLNLCSI